MTNINISNLTPLSQEQLQEIRKDCLTHPSLVGLKGHIENLNKKRKYQTIDKAYWLTWIKIDGINKKIKTHRLVYIIKNGKIETNELILHICGNSKCLNIDHLKKGNHKENVKDRFLHGTNIGRSKYNKDTYELIVNQYKSGKHSSSELAKIYGYSSHRSINFIVKKFTQKQSHLLSEN